jgi:hypothetical protein
LRIRYSTAGTAWTLVNRRPRSLTVDGQPAELDARANPTGGTTVRLPAGDHSVELDFAAT